MKALNIVIALFALYMLIKHGRGALRFISPSKEQPGPRMAHLASLLNVLLALALLAASVNLMTRGFLARLLGW